MPPAPRRRQGQGRSRRKAEGGLPPLLFAQASPHSLGGTALFDAGAAINSNNVANFTSDDRVIQAASVRLQERGFRVLQVSRTTINIAAPPKTFEQAFDTTLTTDERPVIKGGGKEDTATYVDCADTEQSGLIDTRGTDFSDLLEGVAIEEPVYFHQNAFPPPVAYWHLDVPADVSLGVDADRVHRDGITGRGVRLVMVDSGWFRHPFFVQRGYRSNPVVVGPGAANPNDDEVGHGTGESANAFAAAPDIDFTMVKLSFTNSTGGFNAGVALGPQIISCSWGSSVQNPPLSAAQQALAAAVAAAVASGIIVVFSAANGGFGFPGQHPDVISAGGVYMEADGSMRASDYTSGFASNVYPGRNVPDVSGLVGMRPGANYIMLPVQPNDELDQLKGNAGAFPNGDETAPNDGWAAFSGTSAAAPQIAGVCALIKQACPRLTPAAVRTILMRTARDVTVGQNAMGNAAGPGYDLATGAGLVTAKPAVLMAKVRCLRIIPPRPPILPPVVQPPVVGPPPPIVTPPPIVGPPIVGPPPPVIGPPPPIVQPPGPIDPGPIRPQAEAYPEGYAGAALSEEDVSALEDLIVESEGDLDL
jgi:subtilisin family serine protease